MPADLLTVLGMTANALPDLPPADIQIKVGGIIGTLCWTYAAVKYRKDVGVAIRELFRVGD